jgi:large subunit ribosomal protein L7/L12
MKRLPVSAKVIGRRKTALATLEIVPGLEQVRINGQLAETVLAGHHDRLSMTRRPFRISTHINFDAKAKTCGGGLLGQARSIQLSLSRAFTIKRPETRCIFREYQFLTRDPRKKERRKYGLKKARKSPQFSKRSYKIFMSQATDKILESLKTLTLIEAADLVSKIEDTFGVDTSRVAGRVSVSSQAGGLSDDAPRREKTTFDVVLELVADDKRIAALKVIRSLTDLGLKEAKDFCSSLPKAVKEGVSKEEADTVKKELERVGGQVSIKLLIKVLLKYFYLKLN